MTINFFTAVLSAPCSLRYTYTMPKHVSSVWYHFKMERQNNKVYGFCKYCSTRYFNNATRMVKHLATCDRCPDEVRLQFQDNKTLSVRNDVRFGETATVTAPMPSVLGLVDQPQDKHESSEGTSSQACVIGSCQLSERQTTVQVLRTSTSSSRATSSTIAGFCDRVSSATQKELDESLARAIFATGTALGIVENPFWISFFNKLRPAYKVPSRYVMSHSLLDREDGRISNLVSAKIAQAECVAIVSDGWTSVNNTPIVNFIISTPEPVFLRSVTTGENRHTGQYIAQLLETVIDEVGVRKVMAVVTDNAANMKAAWRIINDNDKYKHIHCYGCVAHGLHLLATDICSIDSVEKLLTRAKNIVKFVKYKHLPHAAFYRIQQETLDRGKRKATQAEKLKAKKNTKPLSLILPSPTRWGTNAAMLKRLLETKKPLQHLVMEEDIDAMIEQPMKTSILDNSVFWLQIENLNAILEPVADAIKKIETDSPVLSDVPKIFFDLRQSFDGALHRAPVTSKEEKLILKYLTSREEFCSNVLQRVANMLDPKYCGSHLSDEEVSEVYSKISDLASRTEGCDSVSSLCDLAEFRAKEGLWKSEGIWHAAKTIPGATWWKGLCANRSLAQVASRVLSLPASSASAERNWSTYKHVHGAKRNRLTDKRAHKLVNVASNLKFTLPCPPSSQLQQKIEKKTDDPVDPTGRIASTSTSEVPPPPRMAEQLDDDGDVDHAVEDDDSSMIGNGNP